MNRQFQELHKQLQKLSEDAEALQNALTAQLELESKQLSQLQDAKRFDPGRAALQGQYVGALENSTSRLEKVIDQIFECQDEFDDIADSLR